MRGSERPARPVFLLQQGCRMGWKGAPSSGSNGRTPFASLPAPLGAGVMCSGCRPVFTRLVSLNLATDLGLTTSEKCQPSKPIDQNPQNPRSINSLAGRPSEFSRLPCPPARSLPIPSQVVGVPSRLPQARKGNRRSLSLTIPCPVASELELAALALLASIGGGFTPLTPVGYLQAR